MRMKKQLLFILLMLISGYTFAQWNANPKKNTPVAVRENTQDANVSVSDGAGGVIVVYIEGFWDPVNFQRFSQIYAQRLNADGVAQWNGSEGRLLATVPDWVYPIVASDGSGGAVILWDKQNTNGSYDLQKIIAQRINANGDKQWGANGIEITPTASNYSVNEIISDNGGFVFTYGHAEDSYAQKLDMNGALQWGANGVKINDANGEYEGGGRIIKDGTGYLIVFGEEYEINQDDEGFRILWQKLNANGSKNGANVLCDDLVPTGGYSYYPQGLVADGNGGIYYTIAAYKWDETEIKLYLQHVNSSGVKQFNATSWGMLADASVGRVVESQYGDYIDYETSLASDGTGGVVLVYTDTRNGNYGLYAQRFNSAGTKLWNAADVLVMQGDISSFREDQIKINAEGNFVFVMEKGTSLYVQKLSPLGALLYPASGVLASSRNGGKSGAEMVVLNDKVVLVWSEYNNGSDIYAQSVLNNGELAPTVNFNGFSVINTRTQEGFNTIQAAINDTDTQNGDELRVAPGTYTENVTITKELSISGNNVGTEPWNWSKPATIIKPAVTFGTTPVLFIIEAKNVAIDGLYFDGTNDALSDAAPVVINGKAVRTSNGIYAYKVGVQLDNLSITNNKFENFTFRGIGVFSDGQTNNITIENNEIDNLVAQNTTSSAGNAYGVHLQNQTGTVENNRVSRAIHGIRSANTIDFYSSNDKLNVLNNTVTAYKAGIYVSGATNRSAPAFEVSDNSVTKADYDAWTADGLNKANIRLTGMAFYSLGGNNPILVNNNNVSNAWWGLEGYLVKKSDFDPERFKVSGGTFNNNYIGIDSYNANNNTYTTSMVLSGVTITNSEYIGVLNEAQAGNYKSELILKDGVQILHSAPTPTYENAISIYGANAQLNELNDTKISGAYKNFISFYSPSGNAPMNGLTVNGENVTYDGVVDGQAFNNYKPSALFDLTLRDAVKARIYDGDNNANTTAGKVLIHAAFPLPVQLIEFNATLKNNGALITWATASEFNNSHFIIEKSFDGVDFKTLTTVGGKGTTQEKSNYQFTDISFSQSAYYRLTQVDLNSTKVTYHDLVRYVKGLDAQVGVKVYPNPTSDKIFVNTDDIKIGSAVKLINLQGKVLASQTANQTTLVFEVQQLPAGVYFVQYSNGTKVQSQKVVKK